MFACVTWLTGPRGKCLYHVGTNEQEKCRRQALAVRSIKKLVSSANQLRQEERTERKAVESFNEVEVA